jgi:hypothetical protein
VQLVTVNHMLRLMGNLLNHALKSSLMGNPGHALLDTLPTRTPTEAGPAWCGMVHRRGAAPLHPLLI